MPSTPVYGLPYPAPTAPANVPADIEALAEHTEAVLPTLTGGLTKIAETILAAPAATFDFPSIPQTFSSLMLSCALRSDQAATVAAGVRFNGDTGAGSYASQAVTGAGSAASAAESVAGSSANVLTAVGGGPANSPSIAFAFIPGYRGAFLKAIASLVYDRRQATTGQQFVNLYGGMWIAAGGTAAITRITLTPGAGSFATGSRATLYGL